MGQWDGALVIAREAEFSPLGQWDGALVIAREAELSPLGQWDGALVIARGTELSPLGQWDGALVGPMVVLILHHILQRAPDRPQTSHSLSWEFYSESSVTSPMAGPRVHGVTCYILNGAYL